MNVVGALKNEKKITQQRSNDYDNGQRAVDRNQEF